MWDPVVLTSNETSVLYICVFASQCMLPPYRSYLQMDSINMLYCKVMVDLKPTFPGFRIPYVCCSSDVKLQFTKICNTTSLLTLADVFLRSRNM